MTFTTPVLQHILDRELRRKRVVEQLGQSALVQTGYQPLRDLTCEFHQGTLRLYGQVPSYYLKRLATHAVEEVVFVEQVDNLLEVNTDSEPAFSSAY